MNLYIPDNNNNLLLLDSPGDTEINGKLNIFPLKGYEYSNMIIYVLSEEAVLDLDDMENNENLKYILFLKIKYKLPLIILLTHSDGYCRKVKETDEQNWKQICQLKLEKNKNDLCDWLNKTIKTKFNYEDEIKNDIKHVVLIDKIKNEVKIADEDVIERFDKETKRMYETADEIQKGMIIQVFKSGIIRGKQEESEQIMNFIKNELGVLGQKELIEQIKIYLPSQYHSALKELDN